MLVVLLGAIFIGVPISFTLLFLAMAFGYFGLGGRRCLISLISRSSA